MILMIDNYDSFTYNLVQMFQITGENVEVWRNDKTDLTEMARMKPSALVISPGPGGPDQAGVSVEAIRCFETVYARHPADKAARQYLEWATALLETPPKANWRGIWKMEVK